MKAPQSLLESKTTCRDACTDIRKGAAFDRTYIIMNILATIIACYGLLANSPAVVIGAMVVAMLIAGAYYGNSFGSCRRG
jgi:uncharacterized membrane protein